MNFRTSLAFAIVGLIGGVACTSTDAPGPAGGVASTTTGPPAMTFAECQKSAEYPGGRYAVEYDAGVCKVQKPADAPVPVSYANCDEVRAAGKAPLEIGQPGYSDQLDRDGDGTACDS